MIYDICVCVVINNLFGIPLSYVIRKKSLIFLWLLESNVCFYYNGVYFRSDNNANFALIPTFMAVSFSSKDEPTLKRLCNHLNCFGSIYINRIDLKS